MTSQNAGSPPISESMKQAVWFIPITLVPEEWINNELPSGHFWRDLMCQ